MLIYLISIWFLFNFANIICLWGLLKRFIFVSLWWLISFSLAVASLLKILLQTVLLNNCALSSRLLRESEKVLADWLLLKTWKRHYEVQLQKIGTNRSLIKDPQQCIAVQARSLQTLFSMTSIATVSTLRLKKTTLILAAQSLNIGFLLRGSAYSQFSSDHFFV